MQFEQNSLEYIIADIESHNDPLAIRFEPGVYIRTQSQAARFDPMVELAKTRNNCTHETAKIICSISWGAFQIMGYNLYERHGLNYPFGALHFASDGEAQAQMFRLFCEARSIYFSLEELQTNQQNVLTFAKSYNGSLEYANEINKRLAPRIV